MKKLLFFAVLLVVIVGYYFVPKNIQSCGSSLPIQCNQYKCERGFPYRSAPIGSSQVKCFLGGEPVLESSR